MRELERLEQYTAKRRGEVLLVTARVQGAIDEILIFKGFSSSLVQATDYDPDVPLLPAGAEILAIARLHSPYDPQHPRYIEADLTWETVQPLLSSAGV